MPMSSFTLQKVGVRCRNTWVVDGMSEILSTFILALFVYASGAQYVLSHGEAGSPTGRALAGGVGLTIAVYASIATSGASANPNVTLMFCLLGKMRWKKLPLYVVCEMVGAFLAAAVTYFIYEDLLDAYDGGQRAISGDFGTANLFTSFPHPSITRSTGFFDVVMGTALLTGAIAAITDPINAGTPKGLIPLVFTPMLYGIVSTFGVNTGAAINISLDVSGRTFAAIMYGSEVFSTDWSWIPPLGGLVGAVLGPMTYQFMVGNHLLDRLDYDTGSAVSQEVTSDEKPRNGAPVLLKSLQSPSTLSIISTQTESTVME